MNPHNDILLDELTTRVLEFDKIKKLISEFALTEAGKKRALTARPFSNPAALEHELTLVDEIMALIQRKEPVPIWGLVDIAKILEQLRPQNSFVEPQDYWTLSQFVEIVESCKKFFHRHRNDAPNCYIKFNAFVPLPALLKLIRDKINDKGEVLDTASPQLADLRRKIRHTQDIIHQHLEHIIHSLRNETILQDFYYTIRNGRYVLPVRAGSKKSLPGIIQGASHTGETLFIEPFEIVEETNDLADLQISEKNELRKILIALGDAVRHHFNVINQNLELITELDYLNARAQFAITYKLTIPGLFPPNTAPSLALNKVHHPLLYIKDPSTSVPVDIQLNPEDKVLVITGPNAGGKTTALKTIGLTAMMFQSAIPVALSATSRLPVFSGIFADIGDEQDVTSGLSTFTAHIKNIQRILAEATPESLVLLDELGSATDPLEGSALAVAILEKFATRSALTIVTTHLSGLKEWAHRFPHARNAAVKLDEKTSLPTYKIYMDIPGTSEALIIARQEGMPPEIIARAREIIQRDELNLADLILDLQEKERQLAEKINSAELELQRAKELAEKYETLLKDLEQKQKGWKKEMLAEKEKLLLEAKTKIERLIAELPTRQSLTEARKQITEEKDRVEAEIKTLDKELKTRHGDKIPQVGDLVYSPAFNQYGKVLKINQEEGVAELQLKNIKAYIPLADLEPVSDENKSEILRQLEAGEAKIKVHTTSVADYKIDLHGKTVEEALKIVDEFLDRAVVGNLPFVKIIHGHGSGKLQRALHDFLRSHPHVQSFNHPPLSSASTIVYLKE